MPKTGAICYYAHLGIAFKELYVCRKLYLKKKIRKIGSEIRQIAPIDDIYHPCWFSDITRVLYLKKTIRKK